MAMTLAEVQAQHPGMVVIRFTRTGQETQYIVVAAGTTLGTVLDEVEKTVPTANYRKFVNSLPVETSGTMTPAYVLQNGDVLAFTKKIDAGR